MNVLATLGDAVDRLLGQRGGAEEPAAVERLVRERFRFLEERQGFELAASTPLADGAVAAYVNPAAHRAVAVFARRTRGVWTGIGAIPEDGRVPPVNRETIADGLWREFGRVDIADRTLADALDEAAASLGDRRAA